MKSYLLLTFLLICSAGYSQTLPTSFEDVFKSKGLDKKYTLNAFLKPSYLQADFNGDVESDVAVLVVDKTTKKKGILLIHGKTGEHFLFGAGTAIADSDDFTWADKWSLYRKKTAYETQFDKKSGDIIGGKEIKLARPAILIEDY